MNPLYEFTIPVFAKALRGLRTVLTKAREHGLEDEALLADRIAPDMFPLSKQVQIATDNAKGAVARLTGTEMPVFEDTETTIEQLLARIDATLAYIESVPQEAFAEAATREVTLPYFPGKFMTGFEYTRGYAIPNFFFHVAMTYAIVRKNGVAIGKVDYMHGLPLQDL